MIPSRDAQPAQPQAPRCYPLLMIGGVYRASFAKLQEGPGVATYTLPRMSQTASRYRVRRSVRRMREILRDQASRDRAVLDQAFHEQALHEQAASMPCACGVCTS
jgi:hypothetical protein